jgi:hypothetical protein
MIAEKDTTRTVASTLGAAGAENMRMSIAEDAMAHVMDIMTNLYKFPIRAMLREYSTNARDAHIETGQTRPIEVQLPTMMSPFLRIKDFGIGLDREGIRTIYSQYGASTKRATNEQTGMLGMGCKSALTYTDQFSVISVKNSRRIIVSIERDEDGLGVMRVMSENPLGDPVRGVSDGTEVVIPCGAGDFPEFQQEADFFFSVWPEGTVLVNGQQPRRIDGMWLSNDLLVIDGEQSYVVMGNVPYPTNDIKHGMPRHWGHEARSIMAFVPIGAINFTPDREGLRPTRTTTSTLNTINRTVKAALQGAVQKEVAAASTPREAIQTFLKYAESLGASNNPIDYQYNGAPLPASFVPAGNKVVITKNGYGQETPMLVTDNNSRKLSRADARDALPVGMWDGTLILHGYNLRGLSAPQKRKMQKYCEDKGISNDIKRFVLVSSKPTTTEVAWFGSDRVVPWATIHAIKLPMNVAVGNGRNWGRLPGSYDFYESLPGEKDPSWKTGIAGDQIDQSRPIYYVHGGYGEAATYAGLLAEHHVATGCYVVALGANRIAKFCRTLPSATEAKAGTAKVWEIVRKSFTPDEVLAYHIEQAGSRHDLRQLDPARLDDPDLIEAIRVANTDITAITARRKKFWRALDRTEFDAVQWSNPLDKYPVFAEFYEGYSARRNGSIKFSDDMYLYFAAKFTSITTKGA